MKILGIIPARGGSKGIPRKNLVNLGGKPLLYYTAQAALKAKFLSRVILSTDDPEIARVGKKMGLDVPFLRPKRLAKDTTPTLPVLLHALNFLAKKGESYDAVCILQPTSPFREKRLIDRCIRLFIKSKVQTLFTVVPVPGHYHPDWVFFKNANGLLKTTGTSKCIATRRQALKSAYCRDGALYLIKTKTLTGGKTLYGKKMMGYLQNPQFSVNLDTRADLKAARNLWSHWRSHK